MKISGYFISEGQHLRVCRALDVLCVAMEKLKASNEKRGDEPDDYVVSCMEIVHDVIAETMYDVVDSDAEKTV